MSGIAGLAGVMSLGFAFLGLFRAVPGARAPGRVDPEELPPPYTGNAAVLALRLGAVKGQDLRVELHGNPARADVFLDDFGSALEAIQVRGWEPRLRTDVVRALEVTSATLHLRGSGTRSAALAQEVLALRRAASSAGLSMRVFIQRRV